MEKEFKTLEQWGASKGDVFESARGTRFTVDSTDEYTATGYTEYSDGENRNDDTWSLDGMAWSLVSRGVHHPTRAHRISYVAAITAGADYDKAKQIAALPDMVVPLMWDQIDAATLGATSVLGFTYTVWAIDGFGYVKFPETPCGERLLGGIEAAQAAAQAHHVATILAAFGINL